MRVFHEYDVPLKEKTYKVETEATTTSTGYLFFCIRLQIVVIS